MPKGLGKYLTDFPLFQRAVPILVSLAWLKLSPINTHDEAANVYTGSEVTKKKMLATSGLSKRFQTILITFSCM